jgi:hypothetical protein
MLTGAHQLLQVRCAVLDGRLPRLFGQWYPRFQMASEINEGHSLVSQRWEQTLLDAVIGFRFRHLIVPKQYCYLSSFEHI